MELNENEEINSHIDNSEIKQKEGKIIIKNKLISPIKSTIIKIYSKLLTLIISLFLIFYIDILIIFFYLNKNKVINKLNHKQQLNKKIKMLNTEEKIEEFVNSIEEIKEDEILKFMKANSEKILFDRTQYPRNNTPDISVILIMKNQAHLIHKSLRSIQNQSLKNIEIIVSIDCSLDNSTETIYSYMKKDKRISMITHETNVGTMKNRIDGIRKAKGKYITMIDGDDALIHKDILKYALHIATLGNIDIVEFILNRYKGGKLKGVWHNHKFNGIIRQPELRTRFFSINEHVDKQRPIICRNICGKIIKNEVLQKAIENIGPEYSDDYIIAYEDTIMTVSLFQIAQSYYLFKQSGYYYSGKEYNKINSYIPNRKCLGRRNHSRALDSLKFINYLYDKMDDNEIERQTLYHEIISINSYNFSKFFLTINDHYKMLYRVLDKLVANKYLTEKEKEKLRTIKNKMVNKENNKI